MTLLIANVGTSDIAVKIGDYFIPLGFNREEINLELPGDDTAEYKAWGDRVDTIRTFANQELGMNLGPKDYPANQFRHVSEQLLKLYQKNPSEWHSRISIGRIWGVIQTTLEMEERVNIKLVVTDQPISEKRAIPWIRSMLMKSFAPGFSENVQTYFRGMRLSFRWRRC